MKSTITLETSYYQGLCDLIAQQEKVINIYHDLLKLRESEIKDMKGLDLERVNIINKYKKVIEEYKVLEKMLTIQLIKGSHI